MNYWLVSELNGRTVIFGRGNTRRTAHAAGDYNARQMDVWDARVVTMLPKEAIWYMETEEYAQACREGSF